MSRATKKSAPKRAKSKTTASKNKRSKASSKKKFVYSFGGGKAEGDATMRLLLGGKGANLAEMADLGLPVPPGFTISTDVCAYYYDHGRKYPPVLNAEAQQHLAKIEKIVGRKFGDPTKPLLVSVRSGAPASMPGMMDTVLNLGLNDDTVQGLIDLSGSERFAYDSYRRFVQMYGGVVLGMKPESEKDIDPFEAIIEDMKKRRRVELDTDLDADDLKSLVAKFKDAIWRRLKIRFPDNPQEQLWGAISAVFGSWNNQRAITYRKLNKIPSDWGTAVNVQAMVFGNLGDDCATGVAFTRDPSTGEKSLYGEFLVNAQGEDVVAGTRTPQQITLEGSRKWAKRQELSEKDRGAKFPSLDEVQPKAAKELRQICQKLERHYRGMQDLEFTIEKSRLFMLQTRMGKRTAAAGVKIAVDMVAEKLIDKKTAVSRVNADELDQLLHPQLDQGAKRDVLTKGLPASPGAATGEVVFSADEALELAEDGKDVILVRIETSPDDIHGMNAARAILTARGGMTSHAAVVARGMGKCCVAGAGDVHIDYAKQHFQIGKRRIRRGDVITLDGSTGEVFAGDVPKVKPKLGGDFAKFISWTDGLRRLKVRANADTPQDAKIARSFGAEGIGLCRTEHMFFDTDRIQAVREMILSTDKKGRERALRKIRPMQKRDFKAIFKAMSPYPVTIRLLDPPLHEFLPQSESDMKKIAKELGVSVLELKRTRDSLHEFNPMLGHRGCRLGITYPEIYAMQAQAIAEAACELRKQGVKVVPEIMIPLVAEKKELAILRALCQEVIDAVAKKAKVKQNWPIGTMIELPRAALTADQIAEVADFFSFGTNDLTQTAFGLSRDDAGKFLPEYVERGILPTDPFVSLDQSGVGELVRIAAEKGRAQKPGLKLGICGEHGGDPESVEFCHRQGLDYVSCSPYRVPIARLAAAHGNLRDDS